MESYILLAGCAPDTSNLGVNALCHSTVMQLKQLNPELGIVILDHGQCVRENAYKLHDSTFCDLMGAKNTKRFYRTSSFYNIYLLSSFPFSLSKQVSIFRNAIAILDISGGDSFTDLYGKARFKSIMFPKILARKLDIPLVLLPQTYGPFQSEENYLEASGILKYSTMAFARDQCSFLFMKEMLSSDFDEDKHRLTSDVAFIMPPTNLGLIKRSGLLPGSASKEIFGLNVSGLIYNSPETAKCQYGIQLNYNSLVRKISEYILNESDGELWLVPHVLAAQGHYESDIDACRALKSRLSRNDQLRTKVISGDYDQCDIKGVISACNWFAGTRMHATVAALSTMVPTVGLAYSGKFQGVFESVGQGESVVDLRSQDETTVLNLVLDHWRQRSAHRVKLERDIPQALKAAKGQFDKIADFINEMTG